MNLRVISLSLLLLWGGAPPLLAGEDRDNANLVAIGILQHCFLSHRADTLSLRETTVNHFYHENIAPDENGNPIDPEGDFVNNLASSEQVDKALALRFLLLNKTSSKVRHDLFPREFQPHILTEKTFMDLFKNSAREGWQEFDKQRPKNTGIVTVSRLVYSADGNTALMSIWHQYAPLAGTGNFLIFRRIGKFWTCQSVLDAPSGVS